MTHRDHEKGAFKYSRALVKKYGHLRAEVYGHPPNAIRMAINFLSSADQGPITAETAVSLALEVLRAANEREPGGSVHCVEYPEPSFIDSTAAMLRKAIHVAEPPRCPACMALGALGPPPPPEAA